MTVEEQEDGEVRGKMQDLAKFVNKQLPFGWGFIVLAFPYGEGGRMNYVSNANRGDVVRTMYEFIDSTKEQFGDHVTETEGTLYDEQIARLKHRVSYLEGLLLGLVRGGDAGKNRLLQEIERLWAAQTSPGQGKS